LIETPVGAILSDKKIHRRPQFLSATARAKKGPEMLSAFAFYQDFSDALEGEQSPFLNTLRIQDLKGP
jgi:hypothetical protein